MNYSVTSYTHFKAAQSEYSPLGGRKLPKKSSTERWLIKCGQTQSNDIQLESYCFPSDDKTLILTLFQSSPNEKHISL